MAYALPYDDAMSADSSPTDAAYQEAEAAITTALGQIAAAIDAAVAEAATAIDRVPPRRGFELATQLRDRLREQLRESGGAGELVRAQQVRRIRKDEELDLAVLGASLSTPLTGQRVSQMIKRAKAAYPPPAHTPEG
jgi:hypothetical protein